ncbi:SURF1 family protein [Aurantiacibacter sp. MUD11]|uniref:SURF1 family cytochrome oxidase biogenesis protein n=1 Tax=Aurantiacibacter sp. MUD11 TaxID=3003265 RepID=UPI0022AA1DCF|nr:SURF1 family cytochrome oxidase biogenesis protein [Aurantiacibacter sp. MUD11]WAT17824.1 SURF1 family protein [Aurantiacibacter sp. MUD11]
MTRRIPIIPTIFVMAAAATMVALGVWQLGRADWKAGLLDRYAAAANDPQTVAWPQNEAQVEERLFQRSNLRCDRVVAINGIAGRSASGQQGWMQLATCAISGGGEGEVALGWSSRPDLVSWDGGVVEGVLAPSPAGARIIAEPPVAGLEPLARPDPSDLPNNHLAYAGQWFFFALTALVIYWLALRRRWRDGDAEG